MHYFSKNAVYIAYLLQYKVSTQRFISLQIALSLRKYSKILLRPALLSAALSAQPKPNATTICHKSAHYLDSA